jgi:Tfp pilus assembly protein PilF
MKAAFPFACAMVITGFTVLSQDRSAAVARREQILHHHNLGKAYYENPTTQLLAVDEFRKALDLAPDSVNERVNYGLALLRAGKTDLGVAELQTVQKQCPSNPYTWFNLAITYKKQSAYDEAVAQLEGMTKLVPNEPVTHFNLGVLYKLTGKPALALEHFEASARLNPNLAGPHFQLYNIYRTMGRDEEATREERIFHDIKKRNAGAAVPEDLDWSFYAEIDDKIDPANARDEGPAVQLKWKAIPLGSADSTSAGMTLADVDGDGHADLIVWSSKGVQIFQSGGPKRMTAGLADLTDVLYIAPGDFNNDGFPDLAVITKQGADLYENRKGTFVKRDIRLPRGQFSKALWLDYDHDYDLDLILLGQDAALARNNGTAGFSDETARFPFEKGTALAAEVINVISDTEGEDLAVTYADRTAVLYRDRLAGKYEPQNLAAVPAGASAISAYDINNDGWIDLAVTASDGVHLLLNAGGTFETAANVLRGSGRPIFADFENRGLGDLVLNSTIYRNDGVGMFVERPPAWASDVVAAVAADFQCDGHVDLAIANRDGSIKLLQNLTETANHWLGTSLTGVKNLKTAYEAKVEVKAGTRYQKQVYRGVPLHFGLDGAEAIDTVRITWSNGMVQNELKRSTGAVLALKEAPRLSGSCPMIFARNRNGFTFITDVLGVAPLGASSGDGQYFKADHQEYIQIPGESLVPRDGRYEVRITEELREVSYLDQVKLLAVDHPSNRELFTNDKFKAPPFPEFRLFGAKRRVHPIAGHDDRGNNVLPQLLHTDGVYADDFARKYDGTAELHSLYLDFGKAARSNRAVLLLNGWVDWADGSTFLASAQESTGGLVMPYLQTKDEHGEWRTVIQDMGLPSGKPKTIAVDLTGKFLSNSREVRIVTSLCVYWDEAFLSEDPNAPEAIMTGQAPVTADLHFRGFSRSIIDSQRKHPERFLYDVVDPVSQWNPTPGLYTRYGNVLPLVTSADDQLVIMGAGDELTLQYATSRFPPLREGWKRDFILLVDGWAKDADANTGFSKTVEPLPYHAMSSYPYPAHEHFPNDPVHTAYREQYNTRPASRLLRPLTE